MFCPQCGKEISSGQQFCQFCGAKLEAGVPGGESGRTGPPWEAEETRWTVPGLCRTLKQSLMNPVEFFRTMKVVGGITDPLIYALITGMTGMMASYVWQAVFPGEFRGILHGSGGMNADALRGTGLIIAAVLTPFLVIAALFVWSGILHVALLLVRGARNGFEATFRVSAYSYGSNIFLVIPFCGGFIALLWNVVMVIIGLKESHGTSGGKATFAVLFPLLLCCGGIMLLVFMGTVTASFLSLQRHP